MMKSICGLSVLVVIMLGFISGSEAQAPKKVRFAYPSSADMGDIPSLLAWEQLKKQGIEVVPTFFPKTDLAVQAVATGSATLSWTPPTTNTDGSPLGDLAGYKVYWGTSQGNYTNSIAVTNAGITSYVVEQLTPATWYFVTTAINSNGVESDYSNVASKSWLCSAMRWATRPCTVSTSLSVPQARMPCTSWIRPIERRWAIFSRCRT